MAAQIVVRLHDLGLVLCIMGPAYREPRRAALQISLHRRRRADRRRQDQPRQAPRRAPAVDPGPRAPRAESVPAALLPGHAALRPADAAFFPVPADRPAARARADGPVQPADRVRFPPGKGPAFRAPDALGGRAAPVTADIRRAQAPGPAARPGRLPAGAAGHAL